MKAIDPLGPMAPFNNYLTVTAGLVNLDLTQAPYPLLIQELTEYCMTRTEKAEIMRLISDKIEKGEYPSLFAVAAIWAVAAMCRDIEIFSSSIRPSAISNI